MPLRIHRDQPLTRISGTLLGIGFVAMGAFSIVGAAEYATGVGHERAMGFGTAAIIVGIIAVICSLLVEDLSNIWCRHPRRWK